MANYLTIRIRLLIAILASVLPLSTMKAEEGKDVLAPSQGWYVGVEGGMPFGFSTFSSFGHDKTHLGWAAGLYGGYRFNSIFSAELSVMYGEYQYLLDTNMACAFSSFYSASGKSLFHQATSRS